ncbi:MAG TPA: penicillin-binding protein 2 [Flavobacteriaceae bacterium]|jgi:penicillin-binding protein 2|nr:penicillin-binding protein 2 [Flavobacteriaceae bacterium]MAY51890.1 penicillin-binding protein 2 [Flavobacteriaceae bacterium]HIB49449.1 penicillin-binding protein 2 [Flavobacteriaceae bacterium]HIN99885.1 penicillin-binding protein 2 [Flavobacteriaceae bacterium]|tara:strand:+ start:47074 stop:48987 length:1914 start_codon:yes stop_codon:yes gene_type:complete
MRKLLLLVIVMITGVVFASRLFYLQVYDTSFEKLSENNAIKIEYDYPQRGYIYDRDGELLVSNQPSYDVMVIPRNVKPLDTLEFCKLLKISKEEFKRKLEKARIWSPRLPSPLYPQLTKAEYASLSEKMYKFEGFYIQKRSLREYQVSHSANVLGFIREVDERIIKDNPDYIMGELIGKQGVEQAYEDELRGTKGVKYIQKDRFNREIGSYKDGAFDTIPERGKDIQLTIDATLQKYGEELFANKRGGIVAIEPATGEILALVTAPNFDPGLLVGRERSANFTKLYYDTIAKPLFDRGLQGEYSPGSPFKTLTALIAMEEGVMNTTEKVYCNHGYVYGRGQKLGCHSHFSPLAMIDGIAQSCNAYFCTAYRRIIEKYPTPQEGIDNWKSHLNSFGLGDYMGYDLPSGKKGLIPNSDFYNRWYNYPKYKWYATATISNAIGQGEVNLTPMQMANFTAAIANRGYWYRPHVIKSIEGQKTIPEEYTVKNVTTIAPEHFEPVVQGMFDVYNKGTASSLRVPDIEICGKTGTAENYVRIDGKAVQLTDHSTFVAFAPKDNPKIAIAVFVENGYWGSRYAGKIASLLIEKYIKGEITRTDLEKFVLEGSLMNEYEKPYTGKPFPINDGKKISAKFLAENNTK